MSPIRLLWTEAAKVWSLLRSPALDISTPEGRSKERYRRIGITAISSLIAKGVGVATVLISVPLTVQYLGADRFGLWMTISSIGALLGFADFGIGGGLLNIIARASGSGDREVAQKAFSSAFLALTLAALLLLICLAISYPLIPWPRVFNVTSELAVRECGPAIAVFVGCVALNLPLGAVQQVQMGFQEGYRVNLWQATGNLIGLAGIFVVIHLGGGLFWLVIASSGGPLLANFVNWGIEFSKRRQWLSPRLRYIDLLVTRRIIAAGGIFMVLQLLSFFGSMSDNLIITQLYGSKAVAGYAVVNKLFGAVFIVQFLIFPLWPAFSEAMARGDLGAARRMFDRFDSLCTLAGAVIASCFVVAGQALIGLWVGGEFAPAAGLIAGFGAWIIVASLYAPISALLSTENLLEHKLRVYGLAAVTAFFLKAGLGYVLGVPGVIWGTVLGYGLFISYAKRMAHLALERE